MMSAIKVPFLHDTGLHMRPAGRIMEVARKYRSDIRLNWSGRTADAKSILELLSLGVPPGAELVFEADGEDAVAALAELESLIREQINRFEDE
jgi:phosphocarrier protein